MDKDPYTVFVESNCKILPYFITRTQIGAEWVVFVQKTPEQKFICEELIEELNFTEVDDGYKCSYLTLDIANGAIRYMLNQLLLL